MLVLVLLVNVLDGGRLLLPLLLLLLLPLRRIEHERRLLLVLVVVGQDRRLGHNRGRGRTVIMVYHITVIVITNRIDGIVVVVV